MTYAELIHSLNKPTSKEIEVADKAIAKKEIRKYGHTLKVDHGA